MRPVLSSLWSLLLFFGFAGEAAAIFGPGTGCSGAASLSKQIRIFNNSPIGSESIFPFIQVPIYDATINDPNLAKSADLWMQAQCNIAPADSNTRTFNTTKLYRAWINHPTGILPGQDVTITVPFYTRLKPPCPEGTSNPTCISPANLGTVPDQFIDWYNSARIYLFYGKEARNSAFLDGDSSGVYPKAIDFGNNVPLQTKPTCVIGMSGFCTIAFIEHKTNPRDNIPFQLQEYTFAAAEGPKPGGSRNCTNLPPTETCFRIDPAIVNYNVSSLDSVYLPVALGPMKEANQDPKKTAYVGDGDTVEVFHGKLKNFVGNDGSNWPFYIPLYFANLPATKKAAWPPIITTTPPQPSCAFILPFINNLNPSENVPNVRAYPGSKLPGTFNMLVESFRKVPPSPPALSSQPSNYKTIKNFDASKCQSQSPPPFTPPALGNTGKAVIDLWIRCLPDGTGPTCEKIKILRNFLMTNYDNSAKTCPRQPPPVPDAVAIMAAAYGWVPIKAPLYPASEEKQCIGGGLADTKVPVGAPTYQQVAEKYCELQYNYLDKEIGLPQADVFNPYAQFIHGTGPLEPNGLGSTAYAFSIDDELSFRSLSAPGIIIAFGGTNGLDDKTKSPVPTRTSFFCKTK
jgi:hypothetical protein